MNKIMTAVPVHFVHGMAQAKARKRAGHFVLLKNPDRTRPVPSCDILITDDRGRARDFHDQGGTVIGVMEGVDVNDVDFPEADAVLTSLDGLTESFARQVFCHTHHIPFTVARTRRLLIRESIADDFPDISKMLYACAPDTFSDGLTAEEIGNRERFVRYTQTAYTFFGYGMWTVILQGDSAAQTALSAGSYFSQEKRETGENGHNKNSVIAGWCGLFPLRDDRHARYGLEMGYLIREDLRKQGIACEACRAILAYAMEELGARRIYLSVNEKNTASLSLAAKLGFMQETEREADTIWFIYTGDV